MATQIYRVTEIPTDIVTAVIPNLQVGQTYVGRYVANEITTARAFESATVPDANAEALPVKHLEDLIIIPVTGEGSYVWSVFGRGILVINEAQ